ncbi:hypothetical protein, partial [Nostoc sp. UCD120]|uniref:hypothetical protein n=1 Tax=Nostoc sp. UCD120 TaxID=2681312 RepID=UPI001C8A5914
GGAGEQGAGSREQGAREQGAGSKGAGGEELITSPNAQCPIVKCCNLSIRVSGNASLIFEDIY